ncbi:MAG: ABC-type multidrug transport system, ATPase and permease component [Mycobacterium sp.]|nr:ABC-type multidrug transport system, ATPase and permease component [Mycobacterium sp.]
MATNRTQPGAAGDEAPVGIAGGPQPGMPPGGPPDVTVGPTVGGPMAGGALGPGGKPFGRPAGIPAGAVVQGGLGGMAGSPLPSVSARVYIGRSLGMLSAVRASVTLLIVLGLIVAALPFVSNAAFGPLTQVMADAFKGGNLADVWGLSGALMSGPGRSTAGPFGWLATPLPFTVLLAIWAAALVLAQVLGFVNSWTDAQVDRKLLTEIRQRVHDHLQSLSLDFFTGARSGALMQRVQMEAGSVQRLLTECLIPPSVDAVVLLIALMYLLALSWQMTIVSLVFSPLVMIWLRFAGKRLQAATRRNMMGSRRLGGELEETISGITDIQVFNAQQQRSERFHEASGSAAKDFSLMMIWLQASSRSVQVFIALSTALVLIMGVAFSASFGLDLASLLVFVASVPTMFASFQRITSAWTTYKSIVPQVASTYELLDTKPTVQERPDALPLNEVHGNLVFEDVAFGYSPNQKILDGLSFSINEGETVALVGSIGSGKSTIFNLLLRFIDPQRGRILLDGNDISWVTLSSLRDQVSKLAQFPFFLKDAIRENVRLARQDATDAEVEEACKLAHIHSIIVDPAKMHRGYDTVVDVQVPSGGQKRLIAMARCLLRKPEVLLLDEPTENLDADQRTRLMHVIREYARDRTCIVVSHDMDFIAAVADRIIVLDGGRVAEDGTHAKLLAGGGLYKKLYEAQNVDPALVRDAAHH